MTLRPFKTVHNWQDQLLPAKESVWPIMFSWTYLWQKLFAVLIRALARRDMVVKANDVVQNQSRDAERTIKAHVYRSTSGPTTIQNRLAPENPFPAAVNDVVDAVRWVLQRPQEFDLSRVAISGFSAGGNLALWGLVDALLARNILQRARFLSRAGPAY